MRALVAILLLVGCVDERAREVCPDCGTGIHPIGYRDPNSANFHGVDLERRDWAFSLCQSCHGTDFRGKAGGAPSCFGCHSEAPTSCATCHGQPPATGAHAKHVVDRGFACSECHKAPATWDEPGHILDANGKAIKTPAAVVFGPLANRDVTPPRRSAAPTYDPASKQCSNVYCHGGVLGDPAAANTAPAWDAGPPAATCGTCHGNPPANHAQSECAMCHPNTVAANGALSAKHIDGVIDVGDGSGTCTACHGSGTQPAPPRGLHGEQLTTELAVGAHAAHLGANRLRGPIACSECHVVPGTVGDAGHIDAVPGAQLVFGTLATNDAAAPVWDRMTGTCSSVYCHGGGAQLSSEPSPGKLAMQSWTATTGQTIYCGACHGLPPTDASHTPAMQLTDCATCHSGTVGPFGNILVGNGKHINGVVDAN